MKDKVIIGTYAQNCYRTDGTMCAHISNEKFKQDKYFSLEKVNLPNGYIEKLVEKDYPINSESVSSLAEGADYRNDPLQAIAQAPQRVNLGDITEAQKFLENPQNNAKIFESVKSQLLEYFKRQSQEKSVEKPVVDSGKENKENKE